MQWPFPGGCQVGPMKFVSGMSPIYTHLSWQKRSSFAKLEPGRQFLSFRQSEYGNKLRFPLATCMDWILQLAVQVCLPICLQWRCFIPNGVSGKALALEAVWTYNPLLPIMPWQPLKTRVSLGNLISTGRF